MDGHLWSIQSSSELEIRDRRNDVLKEVFVFLRRMTWERNTCVAEHWVELSGISAGESPSDKSAMA